MADIIAFIDHLNLSPINTLLLAALGFFIRSAVKNILFRLETVEGRVGKHERRNRKQDWAIMRIEENLELEPLRFDDDEEN